MYTNLTTSSPGSLQILCLFKDISRNSTSAYYAVNLSASVIIALLAPLAVTGNALILMAIWRDQSLRTPSYIILCALAFTDLCTGLITQPFYVAAELICLGKLQENSGQLPFLLFARSISEACGTYFLSLTTALITLMSIERWLHMTRRSLLTVRRSCLIMAVMSLLLIPVVVFRLLNVFEKADRSISVAVLVILLLFCLITTPIAYFKVFQVIHRHQRQIQANGLCQTFGQSAINLAKFKKTVFSILYILAIFYFCFIPFLVYAGFVSSGKHPEFEQLVFHVASIFLLLSPAVNPYVYIWRMNDVRNGVKQLVKQLLCKEN